MRIVRAELACGLVSRVWIGIVSSGSVATMETRSHLEPYTSRPSTGRATEISVWHVAVSPDDVKVMTLEQLDDAFRLDVIDTSTPVWKNGMSTWSTLGNVAGIEDEPSVTTVKQEPQALWPPPAWPPSRSAEPFFSVDPAPPSVSRSPAPPVLRPTVAPSGPKIEAAQAAARAATVTVRPPSPNSRSVPAQPRPVTGAGPLVPSYVIPPSVPPVVTSVVPVAYPAPRRSGALGGWLIGLAALGGVLLTLYRNDVLLRFARSAHRESEYLRVERMLGGPSFGTLRSIDTLKSLRREIAALTSPSSPATAATQVAASPASNVQAAVPSVAAKPAAPAVTETHALGAHAVDLNSLPVDGAEAKPVAAPAAPAKALAKAPPAPKAAVPVAATRTKEPVEKPAAAPAESAPSDALRAAISSGRNTKKDSANDAPAAQSHDAAKPASEAPHAASGGLDLKAAIGDAVRRHPPKKKAKGSEYDPLNGDL